MSDVVVGFDGSGSGGAIFIGRRGDDGGWQLLGHTDEDGLIVSHEDETPVRVTPLHRGGIVTSTVIRHDSIPAWFGNTHVIPADWSRQLRESYAERDSILDLIDATVTAAEHDAKTACGCGCGQPITPACPSPDFATPRCQAAWHSGQAHNPDEVYDSDDAADVFEGADDVAIPLNEPGEQEEDDEDDGIPFVFDDGWHRQPPAADVYGAAYRRHCEPCGEPVIPAVAYRYEAEQLMTWDGGGVTPLRTIAESSIRLECPQCGEPLPGPPFIGTVTCDGPHLVLELHDAQSRVRRTIPTAVLDNAPAQVRLTRLWQDMEAALRRFRDRFNGHRNTQGGQH